ncbi:hypothetical protein [Aporhodopirellula aestuarii]|uniref:Uncharacterized protein n=1 Tax=Aporhodopirellula aestuarii TaxID=2950107 RepID=A0ABT0UBY8_9BACT|nr:hypothetical protein [Aporhodopirellula aestuarii]MCM2373883.1 hypothetical protein [Aporhodopirellula aestuarii]
MSVRKLTTKLAMLLVLITGGVNASAKDHDLPPADPFAFDPDFNWFEPIYDADILDMKPKKRAHVGWFSTYDRIHLYGSRPNQDDDLDDGNQLDPGGGHRYEIGYMRPDADTGMLFSFIENSAGAFDGVRVDRLNRLNENDLNGEPTYALGDTRFGLPVFPEDGNVFGFSRRFYDVGLTLNDMTMRSYELSKTWRMEPYHYGGILEPMLGLRVVTAEDGSSLRVYKRPLEDGVGFGNSPYIIPLISTVDIDYSNTEILEESAAEIDNNIYTLQAGFRYFKYQERFCYSAEFRAFTGINLQTYSSRRVETTTVYDGNTTGSEVDSNITVTTPAQFLQNEEFMIGFDARAEIGYQLTKMINVRCGMQLIDLATGVWRSSRNLTEQTGGLLTPSIDTGDRSQSYVAVGYTFGIELNR